MRECTAGDSSDGHDIAGVEPTGMPRDTDTDQKATRSCRIEGWMYSSAHEGA